MGKVHKKNCTLCRLIRNFGWQEGTLIWAMTNPGKVFAVGIVLGYLQGWASAAFMYN